MSGIQRAHAMFRSQDMSKAIGTQGMVGIQAVDQTRDTREVGTMMGIGHMMATPMAFEMTDIRGS